MSWENEQEHYARYKRESRAHTREFQKKRLEAARMAKLERKNKKPRSVRGYRRVHGDDGWRYESRSGYGSSFIRLFSLFLLVIVLFNIVSGSGYDGYRSTVTDLYFTTEIIGGSVRSFVSAIDRFGDLLNENSGNGVVVYNRAPIPLDYSDYVYDGRAVCKFSFKDDMYVLALYQHVSDHTAIVICSSHSSFSVGDVVKCGWMIRKNLKNVTTGKSKFYKESFYVTDYTEYPFDPSLYGLE